MHLTPKESDRLTIFTLAELARRRQARGRKLNAPEAIALICDEVLELAWDGAALEDVIEAGRQLLGPDSVMEGVPELVDHIAVEALFPSGTFLVSIDNPIAEASQTSDAPGTIEPGRPSVLINAFRATTTLEVTNVGPHPISVASHFPFSEVNNSLQLDRQAAAGKRLDIPAGSNVRWQPGESQFVTLVAIAAQHHGADETA